MVGQQYLKNCQSRFDSGSIQTGEGAGHAPDPLREKVMNEKDYEGWEDPYDPEYITPTPKKTWQQEEGEAYDRDRWIPVPRLS